jgi:hypothetical protein
MTKKEFVTELDKWDDDTEVFICGELGPEVIDAFEDNEGGGLLLCHHDLT